MTQGYLVSNHLIKNHLGKDDSVDAGMVRLNSAWYTEQELEKAMNLKDKPKFVDVHQNRGKAFVTKHDYESLLKLCAIKRVDWIGLSKVESIEQINFAIEKMKESGVHRIPGVCAKIESKKGYENFKVIMDKADAIMVDAEDLASEVGWEEAVKMSREIYDFLSLKSYPWFRLAGVVFQYSNVKRQQKVVYTYGVFDMLHPGHINVLQESKKLGDRLIVGVVVDDAVKRKKGPDRPMQNQNTRLHIVKSIAGVDEVVFQEDFNPTKHLEKFRPDVLAKGDDWKPETIDPDGWCEKNGAKLALIPYTKEHSTSSMIEKIRNTGGIE